MTISKTPLQRALCSFAISLTAGLFLLQDADAQTFTLSREQLLKYTAKADFERFPDGRPRVADALLERLKPLCAEEVHAVLASRGFTNQFEGGNWNVLHPPGCRAGQSRTVAYWPAIPCSYQNSRPPGRRLKSR